MIDRDNRAQMVRFVLGQRRAVSNIRRTTPRLVDQPVEESWRTTARTEHLPAYIRQSDAEQYNAKWINEDGPDAVSLLNQALKLG
ncbi:hypothetical protein [Pseudomonas sp.]|uniref:hypothetical protein n=1 Tax=Pseudomonas sp. TaxID=306 RepID=UPI002353062C|nr:hypothetical protein [Pseudomonas sp.]